MEFKLSDIDILSSATKAFADNDEKLKSLFGDSHPYYSLNDAIEGKKDFSAEKRSVLVNELKKQYHTILGNGPQDHLVNQNIELLNRVDTFTVTTGQQLHLFLGPAFVLHKIIATVKAAEHYKTLYPELNFVPVYWLASEDHDFEEIKGTRIFQHQFDWETQQGGATGRFHVREVVNILEDIRQKVTLNAENLSLLADLEQFYNNSSTLSEASIKIVHYLFGKYGIVCIDGDNKALKTQFIPQIKKEILEQENIQNFNAFSSKLEEIGLSLQLKGRDINIFYLSPGKRSRITVQDHRFHVLETDIVFSREELIADIENNPENYSPNALLRPLYQETILPNICYIAGNAEVNYWLQLKNVFEYNRITAPHLVLRPSVWIIPSKSFKWLDKQEIDGLSLFRAGNKKDLADLLDKTSDIFLEKVRESMALRQEIQDLSAEEKTTHLKELVEQGKAYEKLLKKIEQERSEKRIEKMDDDFKKLENMKAVYYDLHHVQERKTYALEMLIKYNSLESLIYNSLEFRPSRGKILVI